MLLSRVMKSAKLLAAAVFEGGDVYDLLDMCLMNKLGAVVAGLQTRYGLGVLIS
jgi:hypothetical protein